VKYLSVRNDYSTQIPRGVVEQTVEFLRRIYGGFDRHDGVFVISYIWKSKKGEPKKHAKTFRYHVSEIPTLNWGPHLAANEEGWDIYFGSALRVLDLLNEPGNSRGGKEDCIVSTCLATDLDFNCCDDAHKANSLPASIEEAAGVIGKLPDPSILVDSGHGVHPYHIYTEDVVLKNKQQRAQYEKDRKKAQSPYEKELKRNDWKHDGTWTIDRIWRLPGFKNWKLRHDPKLVTVLYGLEGEIEKYDQQSLVPIKRKVAKPKPIAKLTSVPMPKGPRIDKATDVENLRATLVTYQSKYHDDALAAASSADEDEQDEAEDIARRAYYLKQLLAGESIEEKGNRDVALTVVCGIICRLTPNTNEFTETDLEYIVGDLLEKSLQAWVDDDEDTDLEREMGKAIDKLRRMKAKDADNREVGLLGLREGLRQLADPLDGTSAKEEALTEGQLLRVGLITYGAFTYCFDWRNNEYYPRPAKTKVDFRGMVRKCWPEEDASCPFTHSFINEEGRAVELPDDHLHRQYGDNAAYSYFSFLEPRSRYDTNTGTYIINPAPWRFTEPRHDPDIDHWLKLLGGDDYDLLCDWLAGVTKLDRPCAALYLHGPPGSGKSLFAHGAAQLWSTRAPLYEGASGNFNESLMEAPTILIDEGFTDTSIKNHSMIMRRLVAQDTHSVNVKFGPKLKLRSHLRFIIAANNDSVFLSGKEERWSEEDSRAMAERIAYVRIQEAATEFFNISNRGNRLTDRWVGEEGLFAKHVLWLGENRDLEGRGRFLVEGKTTAMHEQLLFQGNERNLVCEWVVRFAEAPAILNARTASDVLAAEIGNGIVAVNTKLMKDNWKEFCSDRYSLDHSHLLRHNKALSHQANSIAVKIGDSVVRYWAIPISRILSYAESHDIGDLERIRKHAERDTKITNSIVNSKHYNDPETT
jgi:hypothetical protein